MHGISNTESKIENAKQDDKIPTCEVGGKYHGNHYGGKQNADNQSWFELAPLGTCAFNNITHNRVV